MYCTGTDAANNKYLDANHITEKTHLLVSMDTTMNRMQHPSFLSALLAPCGAVALAALLAVQPAPAAAQATRIAVYPGAKTDASTTEFLRRQMGVDGTAYRTSDGLQKVAAFYQAQPGIQPMGEANKDSAAFVAGCKEEFNAVMKKKMTTGCTHHVTVQSPWMDMKTGKMVPDTLVSIVKQ